MESASNKTKFLSQINMSFGSAGMSLALNDLQFAGVHPPPQAQPARHAYSKGCMCDRTAAVHRCVGSWQGAAGKQLTPYNVH